MRKISSKYLPAVMPPGPFANLNIESLDGKTRLTNCPAQLDTAADRTVLPQNLIDQLSVTPAGFVNLLGFAGAVLSFPIYRVRVSLPTFTPFEIEVTAHPDELWILLGRDVLNRYQIVLDGPTQSFVIVEP